MQYLSATLVLVLGSKLVFGVIPTGHFMIACAGLMAMAGGTGAIVNAILEVNKKI
jgi:hypothetical protein